MRPLRSERHGTHHNGGLTAGADIKLRGIGSFNGASRPLILVDNGQRSAALNSPSKSAIESYLCTDGRPIGLSRCTGATRPCPMSWPTGISGYS